MTATRDSWKSLPLGSTAPLTYSATFTAEEADLLRRGLVPKEMEDKWFIFWESASLFLHRSWTGQGIHQVDFRQAGNWQMVIMSAPLMDFSHLTPDQRLALIRELWDSLDPARTHELTPEVAAELDRRSLEAEQDRDAGRPWAEVRDELRLRL